MTNWKDLIKDDVKEQIEKYEYGKNTYTEDEVEEIMPKVVEFYNNHPEDEDVFRDNNGIIILIQTPKKIIDGDGNLVNGFDEYPPYGKTKEEVDKEELSYMLRNCKFRIFDRTEFISVFASAKQWQEIGGYDKTSFVKAFKLNRRYKKIGTEDKPMKLASFLKLYELDDIEDIDDSEYIMYYSVNVQQVI